MTKLYYDCPIKAAYMAKYFEVHYTEPLAYGYNNGQYTVARSLRPDMSPDTKYYIHPDSLPIFELKMGDTVHTPKSSIGFKQVVTVELKYYLNENGEYQIIQRNNHPFFMPQEEL